MLSRYILIILAKKCTGREFCDLSPYIVAILGESVGRKCTG